MPKRLAVVAGALSVGILASCSHLGYYSQSVVGGARLLLQRRDVLRLLEEENVGAGLRQRLALALEMRDFAVAHLALPDNASYRSYAELDRQYAVWNVVAAPELSVAPKTWCFLIVGCVAYRGYFDEERAERFADSLRREGYDVDVGGVAAYSTIGWFADPLLSTFIDRREAQLAGLIFHELAHQQVFVKGDTTFNESFATAVEREGAQRWLAHRGLDDQIEAYRAAQDRQAEFSALILAYRDRLERAYAEDRPVDWKRRRKSRILGELAAAYDDLKAHWGGYSGYDRWFDREVNNARLALVGAYHQLVPAFRGLLRAHEGRLESFYAEVAEIALLDREARHRRLEAYAVDEDSIGATGR